MTKISVIIPAYNVEAYIGRCLDSLVNQTLSEIEVLVVNDGSRDNTAAVVQEYVERYPDKVRLFTVENGGAASARNHALPHVTGEFIGFVDSDDYVQPTMYESMYKAAMDKDADIVCAGYCRVMEDAINNKPFGNKNIRAEEVFDQNVYEQPLLFDEVPYLWNKIFRADIIKNNGLTFHKDLRIYEDLVFTYTAFMYAKKISRIDAVVYNYIVYRNESLTFSFTEKRFDIFKATAHLLAAYEAEGKLDDNMRQALLYAILKHIYVILEHPTGWRDKKLKRRYIREVFAFLDREFPEWKAHDYYRLQEKNVHQYTSPSHWRRAVLIGRQVTVEKVKDRLKGKIKGGLRFLAGNRQGALFEKMSRKPIQDKAVFLYSQQGKNLHGNMFYLLKAMATDAAYASHTLYVGVYPDSKDAFSHLLSQYGLSERAVLVENGSRRFIEVLARSRYLFSDTSLPPYFAKRDGQVYLNTWHGTPLKTLGKATANDFFDIPNLQKSFILADYLLYPSEYMRDIMIDDYMLKGLAQNRILLCGYPRNEVFLSGDAAKIRRDFGLEGKTLYAYMPTWRGSVRNVDGASQQEQLLGYLQEIDRGLTDGEILCVNLHPYVRSAIDFDEFVHIRQFPTDVETYDFLNACDGLITDYSSAFFDFAITRKPILLFAYDEEEYLRERGMYLDIRTLPFPRVTTAAELLAALRKPVTDPEGYERFVDTYCRYDAPDISARICRQVVLGQEAGLCVQPMPEGDRPTLLIHAGNFAPSYGIDEFIDAAKATTDPQYHYLLTYITANVRPNKANFKRLVNRLPYYGQLGTMTNTTRRQAFGLRCAVKSPWTYPLFRRSLGRAMTAEQRRLYTGVDLQAAVLFNHLAPGRVYEFAHLPCKKILYMSCPQYLNRQVHPSAYRAFDVVLVTNKETADAVIAYTGQDKNVRQIPPIKTLNDLAEFAK